MNLKFGLISVASGIASVSIIPLIALANPFQGPPRIINPPGGGGDCRNCVYQYPRPQPQPTPPSIIWRQPPPMPMPTIKPTPPPTTPPEPVLPPSRPPGDI